LAGRASEVARGEPHSPEISVDGILAVDEAIACGVPVFRVSVPRVVADVRDAGVERGGVDVSGRRGLPGAKSFPGVGVVAGLGAELVEEDLDLVALLAECVAKLRPGGGGRARQAVGPEDRGARYGSVLRAVGGRLAVAAVV